LEEAIAAEQLGDRRAAQVQLLPAVRVEVGKAPLLPQPLVARPAERLGELDPRSLERARLLQRIGALGVARDRVQPVLHLAIGLGDDLRAHRRPEGYATGLIARPSVAVTRYNDGLMSDGPPASGQVPQASQPPAPSLVGQILDGRYRIVRK